MKVTLFTELNSAMLTNEHCIAAYEGGMNKCLFDLFSSENEVRMIVHGANDDGSMLTDEILSDTDVLVWWGHIYHKTVSDEVTERVCDHVNRGMGLICLHSSHKSKPFMRLLGTPADLLWREANEKERLWIVDPTHPIVSGIEGRFVEIPHEEMYGEPFSIPTPDELVFIGWFQGGEVMRSGCVFKRSRGKIFYFQPGHESNSVYSIPEIKQILLNAANYVCPVFPRAESSKSIKTPPCEKL